MNTHQLARILRLFARELLLAPAIEVSELSTRIGGDSLKLRDSSMNLSLGTLTELSSVDKAQLTALIRDAELPIPLRPRDASRDILGKLLRYLQRNPTAKERLKRAVTRTGTASPELTRALRALLSG